MVCRRAKPPVQLVQLQLARGFSGSPKGRSAYVCIETPCLSRLHAKTVQRALRPRHDKASATDALVTAADMAAISEHLHAMAQARALNALGLARRCGDLVVGIDQIEKRCENGVIRGCALCVTAADLAPRSASRMPGAVKFLQSCELGQALGMGAVGALAVRSGRLAKQAAYWLRVWYETTPGSSGQHEHAAATIAASGRDTNSKPIEVA